MPLENFNLQNFHFEVVGTAYEEQDKVFGFVNYGNASAFNGFADNLMVFSRALTSAEIVSFAPKLNAHQLKGVWGCLARNEELNTDLFSGSAGFQPAFTARTRAKPVTNRRSPAKSEKLQIPFD